MRGWRRTGTRNCADRAARRPSTLRTLPRRGCAILVLGTWVMEMKPLLGPIKAAAGAHGLAMATSRASFRGPTCLLTGRCAYRRRKGRNLGVLVPPVRLSLRICVPAQRSGVEMRL